MEVVEQVSDQNFLYKINNGVIQDGSDQIPSVLLADTSLFNSDIHHEYRALSCINRQWFTGEREIRAKATKQSSHFINSPSPRIRMTETRNKKPLVVKHRKVLKLEAPAESEYTVADGCQRCFLRLEQYPDHACETRQGSRSCNHCLQVRHRCHPVGFSETKPR